MAIFNCYVSSPEGTSKSCSPAKKKAWECTARDSAVAGVYPGTSQPHLLATPPARILASWRNWVSEKSSLLAISKGKKWVFPRKRKPVRAASLSRSNWEIAKQLLMLYYWYYIESVSTIDMIAIRNNNMICKPSSNCSPLFSNGGPHFLLALRSRPGFGSNGYQQGRSGIGDGVWLKSLVKPQLLVVKVPRSKLQTSLNPKPNISGPT